MTARNSDAIKDIDLNVMKVVNQDPNAYRDDAQDLDATIDKVKDGMKDVVQDARTKEVIDAWKDRRQKEKESKQVYTDDLEEDAVDIMEKYENAVRR